MSVSAGGVIYGSDYNGVQTAISTVLSTYYGQSVASSQITNPTTTKITAAQWQALYTDLLTAYNHQNGTNGSLTYPTTSKTVLASDFNAYQAMGNNCLTNYTNFYSGYSASAAFCSRTQSGGWGVNTAGNATATHTVTAVFANATYAGYYFNSGGQIRFSAGLSSSNGSAKDTSWASMLSHMGTIAFGVNATTTLSGATTPGTAYSVGWNQLTGSPQLIYSKGTENSTYSPNNYSIYASVSGGTITFTIDFEDLSGYATYYTQDESIGGTVTSSLSLYYAAGAGQVSATGYLPTVGTNAFSLGDFGTGASNPNSVSPSASVVNWMSTLAVSGNPSLWIIQATVVNDNGNIWNFIIKDVYGGVVYNSSGYSTSNSQSVSANFSVYYNQQGVTTPYTTQIILNSQPGVPFYGPTIP